MKFNRNEENKVDDVSDEDEPEENPPPPTQTDSRSASRIQQNACNSDVSKQHQKMVIELTE